MALFHIHPNQPPTSILHNNAAFSELQSFRHYLISSVLLTVFNYLDAKGWNSWKRIGDLLRTEDKLNG